MSNIFKVTVIDKSSLSGNEGETPRSPKITEAVSFSKVQSETGRSNVIITSDGRALNRETSSKTDSYFEKSVISPQCTVIKSDVESSILENSQLANEHGMLLIDIKNVEDANKDNKKSPDVSVDCISSTWQPESVTVDKFIFHDLDKDTTTINNVLIEGSLDHLVGLESIIQPTEDIDQIERLINIFKENNDVLCKKLLKGTSTD